MQDFIKWVRGKRRVDSPANLGIAKRSSTIVLPE
jgi:hypothetical protein